MNEDRYVELMERVTRVELQVKQLEKIDTAFAQELKDEVRELKDLIQCEAADAQEKLTYLSRESITKTTFGIVIGVIVSFMIALITLGV